jgi:hypothetical protein
MTDRAKQRLRFGLKVVLDVNPGLRCLSSNSRQLRLLLGLAQLFRSRILLS